ncbi:MAG: phosphatase PAP2 family protein [Chthoniobacterales bacterium]
MNKSCRVECGWSALLAILALALMLAGFAFWDQPVLEAVRAGAGKEYVHLARGLSFYGDFPWLLGVGLAALALVLRLRQRQWARILTAMLLAGIAAGLLSNIIKLGAGRVRPKVERIEHGWYGPSHDGEWVALQYDFQGFPSSHSACAFGFLVPLFLSRRRLGILGLLAASAIAWSRVQLNAHHVSDVAAGILLGVAAGWLMWRWIVQRGGLSRWLGAPAV